jgi:hypothetical protein
VIVAGSNLSIPLSVPIFTETVSAAAGLTPRKKVDTTNTSADNNKVILLVILLNSLLSNMIFFKEQVPKSGSQTQSKV